MTPTYAIKTGVRYRYYISANMLHGDKQNAAQLNRVSAIEVESIVLAVVKKQLGGAAADSAAPAVREIREHVARVQGRPGEITIAFHSTSDKGEPVTINVPWTMRPSKMPREILRPIEAGSQYDIRPIRSETRATLVRAIATGRSWLTELGAGKVSGAEAIAAREKCSVQQVNRIINPAFLAPDLVQAAVDGRLPRGIGVETLRSFPLEWHQQRVALGLAS